MNLYIWFDRSVRLVLSLSLVLAVISLGWVVVYQLLLKHLPVVRELLGRGNKQPRPQGNKLPRKVVYAPQAVGAVGVECN